MAGRFWQRDEGKWPGRFAAAAKARERRSTEVRCPKCGWVATDKVEFLNVEEDFEGRDVMEFKCGCGETGKSLVVGR